MLRKISFTILSFAILAAGLIASEKLNYRESSLWIFRLNPEKRTENITEQEITDSTNIADTLMSQSVVAARQVKKAPFGGIFRRREAGGRTEFPVPGKINLRNVGWFAAVFASFTVIAIYADQACRFIGRKRKDNHRC